MTTTEKTVAAGVLFLLLMLRKKPATTVHTELSWTDDNGVTWYWQQQWGLYTDNKGDWQNGDGNVWTGTVDDPGIS